MNSYLPTDVGWTLANRGKSFPSPSVVSNPIYNIQKDKHVKNPLFRKFVETGGVVQVVEHLLCKCEALTSNPTN
jgi:hypothetical protein